MIPGTENGGEQFEGGKAQATFSAADLSSLTPEVNGEPMEENRWVRNREAAQLFQMLLEQENASGNPHLEADEAPETSMDIQAINLEGMSNYMNMWQEGLMADGNKANQLTEIAQDTNGQWLCKDTIQMENGKTIVNTMQAASLALLRSKILDRLHQSKAEQVGMLDDGGDEEEKPTDLTFKTTWDEQRKGYRLLITDKGNPNVYEMSNDIPTDLQEALSDELAPYWAINFNNQEAFIQKSEIYFGSFIDQLLDQAWDQDLTSDRERPRDDPALDMLVGNCLKDYNRQKVT